MFEPVHGSAPDIMGNGIASPIATVWACAMMLEHLGQEKAAGKIVAAIGTLLASNDAPKTPDPGGKANTAEVGRTLIGGTPR